jgi:CRISPR/Cas system CSM-associated protein Csm3 (group 7 of RAMP superfamily)
MKNGQIDIRAVALSPICHSRGNVGNVSMVRIEELTDGKRVPFISGNSFKGRLRRAGCEFALTTMGIGNELTKPQVDLLFSGGHLSKGGQSVNLEQAREIERLIPFLSLLGYAAGNTMTESKIRCNHWHLVCQENEFRLPPDISSNKLIRAGRTITSEFGTRRDVGTSHIATRFLIDAEQKRLMGKKATAMEITHSDKGDSAQMIYEYQGIRAGTRLYSSLAYHNITDLEWSALLSALWSMTAEMRGNKYVWYLGGKNSVGYGQVLVELRGTEIPQISVPVETSVALETSGDPVDVYVAHLRANKDEILAKLRSAA